MFRRNLMKRTKLSLAIGLTTAVATFGASATETVYESDSGVKLGIGLSSEVLPRFVENLDFNDGVDNGFQFAALRPGTGDVFGSGTLSSVTGLNSDDRSGQIIGEHRFWFNASKGNLELHTMVEWDGTLDSGVIDTNNPNLERARISYTVPSLGAKFSAGSDLYFGTTIGRLVYLDDDPGFWVNGKTRGGTTWQLGYHKRNEGSGAAGDSAGRQARIGEGRDHDLFSGYLGFSGDAGAGGSWYLEPFAFVQNRHSEDRSRTNVAQDTDTVAGYFGSGARYQNGAFLIEGELVTHQGTVTGTNTASIRDGFDQNYDEMDISSFAAHLRIVMKNAIGGEISPYFSYDWASGDSDPTDDDLEGYVPVGTSTDLRADNIEWGRLSVVNQMPNAIGNNAVEFGFETMNLGIGPNLGGLTNNGFGANPGYHRLQAGLKGGLSGKWGISTRAVYLRFSETEAAVAGAQARGQNINDVDEEIGWGFDLQFPYQAQDGFKVTPFVSVFLPGDGAETLAGNDDTAFLGGVKLLATF
jgi:hypothetical protein